MPSLIIKPEGDGCWPDLAERPFINAMGEATKIEVAALPHGMVSGKTSVTFRVEAATGEIMVFETSLALLRSVVRAFEARYGD